jgi:hypothetical protein
MDNDLVDLSRDLLNKDGSPFERWIVELRQKIKDPNVIKDFFLSGESAGKCPSDFDGDKLAKGTAVEKEHSSNDLFAKKIAMDHLVEDNDYYEKLETIEQD